MRIHYSTCDTPAGKVALAISNNHVCLLHFVEDEFNGEAIISHAYPDSTIVRDSHHSSSVEREVREYLETEGAHRALLHSPAVYQLGSPFQQSVWSYLQTIPFGEVRSYADVAAGIGQPSAIRAVAMSCAKNNIALLVPCHRVIRSNGLLGGYRWGIERKELLLHREKHSKMVHECHSTTVAT